MSVFDRYLAVDWSAANGPVGGRDSIWIGEAVRAGKAVALSESRNPRTRAEAMALIEATLLEARGRGERVMLGFDFVFGYPAGAAAALTGKPGWQSLWRAFAERIEDDADNHSNRFEVAAGFNLALAGAGPHYWGHPHGRAYDGLAPTRPLNAYAQIAERRIAEAWSRGPQPVWKLTGAGAVGSQSMLGIARLQRLRTDPRFAGDIAIWPFETDFERDLNRPVTIVEIYPSLLEPSPGVTPKDRAQVEACVRRYAELDSAGRLTAILSAPAKLTAADRVAVLAEEGWIAGVGHEDQLRPAPPYLRNPAAIYEQSFATIRAEADLSRLPAELHPVAIRMIHACGMTDLAADVAGDPAVVDAVRRALAAGMPVLCDCEMARSGIIAKNLHGNELVVTLNDPAVPDLARELTTTRSAAAVELWRDRLHGAVVVIGNAPTALFHLLDALASGAPAPAAIIAAPVGFVGAAESKARLIAEAPVPYVTVSGRRGGSAIASAAFNAIAGASA